MRLFQTNREKNLIRKRFTVRTKLSRLSPNYQIKAMSGPGPTKKKCRAGLARVNRKILSLGPTRPGPKGIKEKSVPGQDSGPVPAPSSLMLERLRFRRN